MRFEIHSRLEILGPDNRYFLTAHGGVFGLDHVFISNMKPISTDGKYQLEYKGVKYEMSIFEEAESKMAAPHPKMKIEIKEAK